MAATKGGGFYNKHSRPQQNAISLGLPLLAYACETAPLPPSGMRFLIVDYGAASGDNSMEPIRMAIRVIRRRDRETLIVVVHNDHPNNDYGALFKILEENEDSYLRGAPNVFPCAIGRSFYKQILPAKSVHVGWSSNSVHWLSKTPGLIPDNIWCNRLSGPVRPDFVGQARRDWLAFLQHRARELKPGGSLVVISVGSDNEGKCGAENVLELANKTLQKMVDARILRLAEYERMAIPFFCRTLYEIEEPVTRGLLADAFQIEHCEQITITQDPIRVQYELTGDVETFAVGLTGWLRAISEPSLFGALGADRPIQQRREIAEGFYDELHRSFAAVPEGIECRWNLALLHVRRR
jgi:SAM dependent carboxyl methyltransferase